jgi:hypothetical protein
MPVFGLRDQKRKRDEEQCPFLVSLVNIEKEIEINLNLFFFFSLQHSFCLFFPFNLLAL